MSLRLIYGKSGSGKSSYCFSEISRLIEEEKNEKNRRKNNEINNKIRRKQIVYY